MATRKKTVSIGIAFVAFLPCHPDKLTVPVAKVGQSRNAREAIFVMVDPNSNYFELETTAEKREWLKNYIYSQVMIEDILEDDSVYRLCDLDEQIAVLDKDIAKLKAEQRKIKDVRKQILEYSFNNDCYQTKTFKRFLYWTFRGSKVKRSEAGSIELYANSTCGKCGETRRFCIKIDSWSDFDSTTSSRRQYYNIPPCECQRKEIQERDKRYKAQENRFIELATMPYYEYLQTPEWKETRKRALKRAKFSCQLCNETNKVLNVHHRTYERRGNENNSDLIVLCEDCHKKHHNIEE